MAKRYKRHCKVGVRWRRRIEHTNESLTTTILPFAAYSVVNRNREINWARRKVLDSGFACIQAAWDKRGRKGLPPTACPGLGIKCPDATFGRVLVKSVLAEMNQPTRPAAHQRVPPLRRRPWLWQERR